MHPSSRLDQLTSRVTRTIARGSSRRGFLGRLGMFLVGTTALPLLPVARGHAAEPAVADADDSDPNSCDYWRYCAIDGYLCSCCGGTYSSCPPGTEASQITWIGTCRNPADGRDYIISYNDCCGRSACGRCACDRTEGDRPVYTPARANDIMWCLGTKTQVYNCSVARVIGTA
ncbi:MAG: methylamine dehydrogenase (amicyanin) light chain [Pseudomonadales bacterium]|nr:methylamine dehydrogenase (amicyanin) light chain [Pseudomonadales bacterium]MCP5185076.1 methylamine dehydrogenase (amicyanin) light chain [Pseudomonadales bacterium]